MERPILKHKWDYSHEGGNRFFRECRQKCGAKEYGRWVSEEHTVSWDNSTEASKIHEPKN